MNGFATSTNTGENNRDPEPVGELAEVHPRTEVDEEEQEQEVADQVSREPFRGTARRRSRRRRARRPRRRSRASRRARRARRAHAIANRTRRSGSRARAWSSGVSTHRMSTARTTSSATFARTPRRAPAVEPSDSPLAVRAIITTTTTRPWTMRIPPPGGRGRTELPSVGEELDHDDRAREGETDPHVQRGRHVQPERERARRKPPAAVSATWAPPAASETGLERADHVDVELQTDDEEEERDTELSEGADFAARLDEVSRARPDDDAHGDVRDHERQPEPHGDRPRPPRRPGLPRPGRTGRRSGRGRRASPTCDRVSRAGARSCPVRMGRMRQDPEHEHLDRVAAPL